MPDRTRGSYQHTDGDVGLRIERSPDGLGVEETIGSCEG